MARRRFNEAVRDCEERPGEGIVHAVRELGEVLGRHFPRHRDDRNELSDQGSVG